MNDALMIITCMVFPFLLAWLIKSVVRLDDEKTASPVKSVDIGKQAETQ